MPVRFDGRPGRYLTGVDLVSVSRIASLLTDYPDTFREYAFTDAERAYCEERYDPPEHYAARWAVKEAYVKAVGEEGANPDLPSIEVVGAPRSALSLSGDGLELLERAAGRAGTTLDAASVDVSMAHERTADLAVGFVLVSFD
jgi:holo-[acyl-carrier protein] synthase